MSIYRSFSPLQTKYEDGLSVPFGLKNEGLEQLRRANSLESRCCISGFGAGTYVADISRLETFRISERQYAQHLKECEFDTAAMQRNLRRLKIRLVDVIMTGQGVGILHKESDGESKDFLDIVYKIEDKNRNASKDESSKIINYVNQFLPEDFKINLNPELSLEEARDLKSLWYSLKYGKKIGELEKSRAISILEDINSLQQRLNLQDSSPDLFANYDGAGTSRNQLQQLKDDYRVLLKMSCALKESRNWNSPTLNGSHGEGNRGNERGNRQSPRWNRTDYQRWGIEELQEIEQQLHPALFRRTAYSEYAQTRLFNSGMSAFHAAMDLFEWRNKNNRHIGETGPLIAHSNNIYFEFYGVFADRGLEAKTLEDQSAAGIVNFIKEKCPNLLILAPIGLGDGNQSIDIRSIIEELSSPEFEAWLDERRKYRLMILIDNSATGSNTDWINADFREFPKEKIEILSMQSLIKHFQDGMDLSFVGSITTIGSSIGSDLDVVRRRSSTLPTALAVRETECALQKYAVEEKLRRHARNANLIAACIYQSTQSIGENSFLKIVSYPAANLESDQICESQNSIGTGSIVGVELNYDFLYKKIVPTWDRNLNRREYSIFAAAYERIVFALAKEINIEINEGTSYGLDRTRFCAYEKRFQIPDNKAESSSNSISVPWFRIAAGSEPIADALLIGNIFARANEIISNMMKVQKFAGSYGFDVASDFKSLSIEKF